jgi:hypothetical protein
MANYVRGELVRILKNRLGFALSHFVGRPFLTALFVGFRGPSVRFKHNFWSDMEPLKLASTDTS